MSAQEKGVVELTLELGGRAMGAVGLDPGELPAAFKLFLPQLARRPSLRIAKLVSPPV